MSLLQKAVPSSPGVVRVLLHTLAAAVLTSHPVSPGWMSPDIPAHLPKNCDLLLVSTSLLPLECGYFEFPLWPGFLGAGTFHQPSAGKEFLPSLCFPVTWVVWVRQQEAETPKDNDEFLCKFWCLHPAPAAAAGWEMLPPSSCLLQIQCCIPVGLGMDQLLVWGLRGIGISMSLGRMSSFPAPHLN